NDRLVIVILEIEPEHAVRAVVEHLEVRDVMIVAQQPGQLALELGYRHIDTPVACGAGVPDPGQHIRDGICQIHPRSPYQLALRTPGIWPLSARSRKQMRQSPNFRSTARLRPHRSNRRTEPNWNF